LLSYQDALTAYYEHGRNKTAAAASLGVPRTTFRSVLDVALATNQPPDPDGSRTKTLTEDRIRHLQTQLKSRSRNELTTEYVRSQIFELALHAPTPPQWMLETRSRPGQAGTPTLQISDLHWGETISPDDLSVVKPYNLTTAKDRLERLFSRGVDLCLNHVSGGSEGLVIVLGGDMLSGDNHEEITESNGEYTLQSVFNLGDHLFDAIQWCADTFGRVFVVCVYGNHPRTTEKPRHKGSAYTNLDWLLYNMLERQFKRTGDDRVQFLIPNHPDAIYRLYSTMYLATHGDRLGSGGGVAGIDKGVRRIKAQYAELGHKIDWVLLHHFHDRMFLEGCGGIVNGSPKGLDEYARDKRFLPRPAEQNLWWTHPKHGITFLTKVVLTDDPTTTPDSWVSWPNKVGGVKRT